MDFLNCVLNENALSDTDPETSNLQKFKAKVADFGLSRNTHNMHLRATGTPFWMAPELLRGESTNSSASDVYSFGIILYEMYSRKDPYEGENVKEILSQVADPEVNRRPPTPKTMSPQVASLMCDCLLSNPDERPSFAEASIRLKRVEVQPPDPSKIDKASVSLFDIFPGHVAEALRDGKQVEPEHKESVCIFFSDIVGFTTLSSLLEPQKVANMLDRLYLKFDDLTEKYEIFKVETV